MKPDKKRVGERIHKIRESKDMTMEQFGSLIESSPKSTVNNWEKGNTLPSKSKLEKIALIGGCLVEWIKYGSLEEYISNLLEDNFHNKNLSKKFIVSELLPLVKKSGLTYNDDLQILIILNDLLDNNVKLKNHNIGDNIKSIRKSKKMTQTDFAELMGLSRSYIGDLENNRRNPSIKTLEAIATALDVPIVALLNDSSNDNIVESYENITAENISLKQENEELKCEVENLRKRLHEIQQVVFLEVPNGNKSV